MVQAAMVEEVLAQDTCPQEYPGRPEQLIPVAVAAGPVEDIILTVEPVVPV